MNKRRLKKAFKKLDEDREMTTKEMSAIFATMPRWLRSVTAAARLVVDSMLEMAVAIGGLSKLKVFHGGEGEN